MAKRGRPRKPGGSGDDDAKPVRVNADLAEMISWIVDLDPGIGPDKLTVAKLLDPLIRGPILNRYRVIEQDVERIKKQRESAQKKISQSKE